MKATDSTLKGTLKGIRDRIGVDTNDHVGEILGGPGRAEDFKDAVDNIGPDRVDSIKAKDISLDDVEKVRDGYAGAIEDITKAGKVNDVAVARKKYLDGLIDWWKRNESEDSDNND